MRAHVIGLSFWLALAAGGAPLPVDQDIEDLRHSVEELIFFKRFLSTHRCEVNYSKTTVPWLPGALRSEGLRLGIGDNFPGDYVALHQEVPPASLQDTVAQVLRDWTKAQGAVLFSATVTWLPEEPAPSAIRVELREPVWSQFQRDDDPTKGFQKELRYSQVTNFISLPLPREGAVVDMALKSGKRFRVSCRIAGQT